MKERERERGWDIMKEEEIKERKRERERKIRMNS